MLPETAASKMTAAHLSRTALFTSASPASSRSCTTPSPPSATTTCATRRSRWAGRQPDHRDRHRPRPVRRQRGRPGRLPPAGRPPALGRAGIVLGLQCSRLARNSADWHHLLELCGMTSTLICDEDALYDPSNFNDRLLLGLKGALSDQNSISSGPACAAAQSPRPAAASPSCRCPSAFLRRRGARHPRHLHRHPGPLAHLFTTFEATESATAASSHSAPPPDLPLAAPQTSRKGEID